MGDAMADLTARFRAEAVERGKLIQSLLDALPGATDPAAICDEIRGHAHQLKGAAGMFGYTELRDRASELEEEASAQAAASDGATSAGAIQVVFDEVVTEIPAE